MNKETFTCDGCGQLFPISDVKLHHEFEDEFFCSECLEHIEQDEKASEEDDEESGWW
jgi:hypothetical protein